MLDTRITFLPTPTRPLQRHLMSKAVHAALSVIAGVAILQAMPSVAYAADNTSMDAPKTYRIPAGPLEGALLAFAGQSGVNLSMDATLVRGLSSPGLSGSVTVEEGFARLLHNSGLRVSALGSGNFKLVAVSTSSAMGGNTPASQSAGVTELQTVTVTGRTDSDLIAPTRQVTTLERAELDNLRQGANSLATLLSKAVSGMGDSSRTVTDAGQTLRGRDMLVLVDGIPLNTNRGSSRNLANINPADVEQIEVLRGSSAIYGGGAAGGIVSVKTRRPQGEARAETTVSATVPLSKLGSAGLGAEIQHYISGGGDVVDYAVNLGTQRVGGSFDAKGNRIAPEPSQGDMFDSTSYSLSTKLGFKLDTNQRVQLSASYYDAKQQSDYGSDPSVAKLAPGSVPARAIKGLDLAEQNRIKNVMVGLDYEHMNLGGHTVAAQVYYRDFFTRFAPFDARGVSVRGANVDQALQNSDVYGGRLTVKSPFGESRQTQLIWGADFNHERTDMPLDIFDSAIYDASGGLSFKKTGELIYMPAVTTRSTGLFAQLQHRFNEQWSVEAGTRYERASASFKDFVPLSQLRVANPRKVTGGAIDYSAWTHNAGVVFTPVKGQEIFASYSQGFQLPDIGLQVRNASPSFNIGNSNLQAIKINSVELGWRGKWKNIAANFSVFESKSDLGGVQSFNNGLVLARTKEVIKGVEAGLDYFSDDDRWGAGTTVSWMKGEELPQNASVYQSMTALRIPPLKLTAYVEYRPAENWYYRLQSTTYGSKDYRLKGQNGFARRDVTSYTSVDLISRWKIDAKNNVVMGVENLLNRQYYPLYSQLLRTDTNTSHLPAAGAVLKLAYTHSW